MTLTTATTPTGVVHNQDDRHSTVKDVVHDNVELVMHDHVNGRTHGEQQDDSITEPDATLENMNSVTTSSEPSPHYMTRFRYRSPEYEQLCYTHVELRCVHASSDPM